MFGLRRGDPKLFLGYTSDEFVSCYLDQLETVAERLGHSWNVRLEPRFLIPRAKIKTAHCLPLRYRAASKNLPAIVRRDPIETDRLAR